MSDDDLTADVREALDPTPAHAVEWAVSRRDTLRALAGVGALAVGPGGAQGAAGTGIADEAYFSNYGWESTAEGGVLTIDGAEFAFDGSLTVALDDGREASTVVLDDGREASTVVGPDGGVLKAPFIPDSGVSRFEFEQDLTDSWGGNDGVGSGISYSTDSADGDYSGVFDGSDYVDVDGVASAITPPVTVSVWLKADNISNHGEIIATRFERFSILTSFNQADSIEFKISNSNGNAEYVSWSASSNTYYLATATYDTDGSGELYIDGTSRGTLSQTLEERSQATIGNQVNHGNGFDGLIDDARIYDKILSPTEISNLYNTGSISG